MNLFKIVVLLLTFTFCHNINGQNKPAHKFTPPIIIDNIPPPYLPVDKEQVVRCLFREWHLNISKDSLWKLFIHEFYSKLYDSINKTKGWDFLKHRNIRLPIPEYKKQYYSNPIKCSWDSVNITYGNFYLNVDKKEVVVYKNKFLDNKTNISVQLYYDSVVFTFPLKLYIPAAKDLIKKRTYKSKQGKWVTNKNLYLVYVYTFNGYTTKTDDSTSIRCQVDKIEVWDSKEKNIMLGEFAKPLELVIDRAEEPPPTIYERHEVDERAFFPKLNEFIDANIQYPKKEKRKKIEGTVLVSFVVELDGSLTQIKIAKGVTPALDNEALRVVQLISGKGKWYPTKINGRPYKSPQTVSVEFKLKK